MVGVLQTAHNNGYILRSQSLTWPSANLATIIVVKRKVGGQTLHSRKRCKQFCRILDWSSAQRVGNL